MRALLLLLVLFVAPTYAEERTWTISTGTYSMAAELVEVHGDIAYLKTGDRVEHIPLARLSAADMQFIASQSPVSILPGPADEPAAADALPAPVNEFNALPPGAPVGPIISDAAPAVQRKTQKLVIDPAVRQPNPVRATNQYNQVEEILPVPPSSGQSKSRTVKIDPRALNNTNARRSTYSQDQNRYKAADRNRSRNDDRWGLFGLRSRRSGN